MMARPTTTPVEAPIAWTMRATISASMLVAARAATLETAASVSPASTTGRRPNRSESGPITSCEAASPNR